MAYVERFTAIYNRTHTSLPPAQDVMSMGFHYMKRADLEGTGTPVTDAAMRTAVQTRWATFDVAWRGYRMTWASLAEYAHADAFPAGSPPHPALLRTTITAIPGTSASANATPPQTAINITLETYNRRHWGRFQLGALSSAVVDVYGMLVTAQRDAFQDAAVVMLNGLLTDGVAPVVITRPAWTDPSHATLVHGMTIWPVIGCRVDSIMDNQRRRRWEHSTVAHRATDALTVPAANPTVYNASKDRPSP